MEYPKSTNEYYFFSPLDRKVFVNTIETFLEDKHIDKHQPKSKVVLEKMSGSNSTPLIPRTQLRDKHLTVSIPPYPSGRDELSYDPINQWNVERNDEVIATLDGNACIDENITISIDATIQDQSSLRQCQMVISSPLGIC